MSEVAASMLVELVVFLAPVQLLALGAVLARALGAVLAGLELATDMGWVVVAFIVAFYCHNSCCPFFLEFD